MSHIGELIAHLCPEGVKLQPLGDIGEFIRGSGLQKGDLTHQGTPAIHYGQIHTLYGTWTDRTKSFAAPSLAEKLRRGRAGDLIIATTSEDDAAVAKATAWLGDREVAVSGDAYIYRHSLDPRYVAYFFQTNQFQRQKLRHITGTKVRRISGDSLARILIPVPPYEVQQEIVNILEPLSGLRAELEAELGARKRQREALSRILPRIAAIKALSPKGIERVRIGDVATQSIEPVRVQSDETYVNLGVRWYGEGAFAREPKLGSAIKGATLYRVRPGQFIYNRMFVVEGSFGVITPELAGGVVSNEFPVYELDTSRLLPAWLALYLLDEYTLSRVTAEVTGVERGTMKSRRRWKEEQFEAFQIELPSVEAQREILKVLGACLSLEAALRDEVAGRRQQSFHYLERLMTFEELPA